MSYIMFLFLIVLLIVLLFGTLINKKMYKKWNQTQEEQSKKVFYAEPMNELYARTQILYFNEIPAKRMKGEILPSGPKEKYGRWLHRTQQKAGAIERAMRRGKADLSLLGEWYYQIEVEPATEVSERTKQEWKQAWNNMCSRK